MTYTAIIITAFFIMLASFSGKLFAWGALGRFLMPRLRFLVALAAGVFTVIIYGLITEALHEGFSWWLVLAFVAGASFLECIILILPKDTHHHHGPHEEHTHTPLDARRMMLGDAVHNMHDGIALVPAFLVSPMVGFGTALGIFLHEVVQETAEFFVLREAGYSTKKALTWNFLVSTTILAGVALTLILASIETLTHPLVAFAAGGFTYVLARDLLPSVVVRARRDHSFLPYVAVFLAGFVLMLTVTVLFPHEHAEEDLPLPDGFELALR